jgi:hypothetical protein
MGRPINKKHFGNTNDDGLGGEGIASIAVNAGGLNYSAGDAATISAPDLPGGTQAVAEVATVDGGTGAILTITVTTAGTGYTSAPTVTFADGDGNGTGTPTLSSTRTNAISLTAYVTGGSNKTGDVVAQKGAKRFKVTTTDGTEVCKLVTATPAAGGEMRITAVDSNGDTYFLSKISARTCTVVRGTGTEFAEGAKVKWTKGTAVLNNSVSVNNA